MAKLTKISTKRLNQAYHYLEELVSAGRIPGASILVADNGIPIEARSFGNMSLLPNSQQVQPDTIFLVASVTKPVTAAAVMLLVERGKLLLDDPVYSIIPEFANRGKEVITVRHLMTHTSGLPDMLPENTQLREKHAPLKEFIRRICDLELDFPAGTDIQYQSCGIAILGEIVERITGSSLPEFLRSEIFSPLGMHLASVFFKQIGLLTSILVKKCRKLTGDGINRTGGILVLLGEECFQQLMICSVSAKHL